jgi:hypothetical protein
LVPRTYKTPVTYTKEQKHTKNVKKNKIHQIIGEESHTITVTAMSLTS